MENQAKVKSWLNTLEKSKLIFLFIHIAVFSYFLVLNIYTPLQGDDITYGYVYGTEEKLSTIGDIVQSMKTHYFTWGGRVIVHSILQFFLMHDKILFDVANTLIFILFAFTIYKYAMKKGVSNSLMLGIYFLLWISIPGVGETIVIKTMSCNYVWGTTILLLFFYPFFWNVKNEWDWYFNAGTPVKGIYAVFMALFGVVAGCTIEACGAMVLFAIGCIGLYKLIKKKKSVCGKLQVL